jgi:non-heme chloroperoxidase
VLLTNNESIMSVAVRYSLLDQLLGLPKNDWNAHFQAEVKKAEAKQKARDAEREQKHHQGTKPSRQLDAYTGTYDEPAYGRAVVSLQDGALQLQWNRYQGPLNHYHYDTFLTNKAVTPSNFRLMDALQVLFTLGADGEVASLRLFDMDFKKVKPKPAAQLLKAFPEETTVTKKDCVDLSATKSTMVTVEPDVRVEVLDWGGTGEAMVMLTGLGDNAHVYDQFAHQFTDRFHVIGITRRGFGRSSQPAEGYDVDTRARDDIKVLDHLNIRQAVFVGHSISGDELSKLGAAYPDRVTKLVYLDALEYGRPWSTLPQPPLPEYAAADLTSVERYAAAEARNLGVRKPISALRQFLRTDAAGKVVDAISPPEIAKKIVQGSQQAQYDLIKAPALAILVPFTPKNHSVYAPYYSDLTRDQQQEFDRCFEKLQKWQADAIERLRTGIKNARVVELPDSNHYVFIRDEARVVREMRKFLLDQ